MLLIKIMFFLHFVKYQSRAGLSGFGVVPVGFVHGDVFQGQEAEEVVFFSSGDFVVEVDWDFFSTHDAVFGFSNFVVFSEVAGEDIHSGIDVDPFYLFRHYIDSFTVEVWIIIVYKFVRSSDGYQQINVVLYVSTRFIT